MRTFTTITRMSGQYLEAETPVFCLLLYKKYDLRAINNYYKNTFERLDLSYSDLDNYFKNKVCRAVTVNSVVIAG